MLCCLIRQSHVDQTGLRDTCNIRILFQVFPAESKSDSDSLRVPTLSLGQTVADFPGDVTVDAKPARQQVPPNEQNTCNRTSSGCQAPFIYPGSSSVRWCDTGASLVWTQIGTFGSST